MTQFYLLNISKNDLKLQNLKRLISVMKKTLLSLVVTALFGFTPISQSDVNEQLNKMFGSMSNTTSGGSYKSVTSRGVRGEGASWSVINYETLHPLT